MSAPAGEAYHGVRQIVRFNWPFYAAAATLVLMAPAVLPHIPDIAGFHRIARIGIGLTAFWAVASLAASWLVYDRSPLMTGSWLEAVLPSPPRTWVGIHAGLDEFTPALRRRFPHACGRTFDVFDPREMTEPSIGRARDGFGTRAERVDYRRLPVPPDSTDAVFLLLSAHELRTHESRCALFREVRRILAPGGRAVVAEHLRDPANVSAYGPGAWHFHSRRTWTRAFRDGGLTIADELAVTPFVRVFVLGRRS